MKERTEQVRMMMILKTRPLKFSSVSGRVRKIGREGEGEKEKKTDRKEEREKIVVIMKLVELVEKIKQKQLK